MHPLDTASKCLSVQSKESWISRLALSTFPPQSKLGVRIHHRYSRNHQSLFRSFPIHPSYDFCTQRYSLVVAEDLVSRRPSPASLPSTNHFLEVATLNSISKTLLLMLQHVSKQLASDFFEYILVSYLCDDLLERLSSQNSALVDGTRIQTQTMSEQEFKVLTPDVVLYDDRSQECIVIDAYHGTSEKEIAEKCRQYRAYQHQGVAVSSSHIYVFASRIGPYDQTFLADHDLEHQSQFAFYRLQNDKLEEEIRIGKLTAKIHEIKARYYHQMAMFISQYMYWRNCIKRRKIVKSHSATPE